MREKLRCAVVGATGMVGQRFLTLLDGHPYFKVTAVAASSRNAGKTYEEAVEGRWKMTSPIPEDVKSMVLLDAAQVDKVADVCDMVFCAVDMPKDEIKALEEAYARAELPVISNNSANRWTIDVPMVVPEINPRASFRYRKPEKASRNTARIHCRKAELLHTKLRSRTDSPPQVRHQADSRHDISGDIRRGKNV